MEKILVSDTAENNARISYIYNTLSRLLPVSQRPKIIFGSARSAIAVEESLLTPEFLRLSCDILCETIAIGCKYGYLSDRLPLRKLPLQNRKAFLCALIAADLPAEKEYIDSRFGKNESCSLDGFFSFRIRALKRKWDKIIDYIPQDFSVLEADNFMRYFVDGNEGRVYVDNETVCDEKYRLCYRSQLVGELRRNVETEILLSGAKEVCVARSVSQSVSVFLRKYYGKYVVFL